MQEFREDAFRELLVRVERLEAESDIRRLQTRYMFLCDTPCPEFGIADDAARIDAIMALYTEEAVWEGVGEYYDGQFGRCDGKAAIRAHFERFWSVDRKPAVILNVHYLTSEQIHVDGDKAEGQWVHCQPWIFDDGSAILRSSRLNNAFVRQNNVWKISRTRTENVFLAPLKEGWATDFPKSSVLMHP